MKIALIGYGKMGKRVETAAQEQGHTLVARIDPKGPDKGFSLLSHADVCIDFSHPRSIIENTKAVAKVGKCMVVGTTGWYEQLPEVKRIVEESHIGFIYAPNFSLGLQLFLQLVAEAARLVNQFEEYDVSGFEAHHNQKTDLPSGTAKAMGDTLLKNIQRKRKVVTDIQPGLVAPDEIHLASVRCGHIPGTHSILLDSESDSIALTHTARNREGFARGAVKAAEWVLGKKGFYNLEDFMKDRGRK